MTDRLFSKIICCLIWSSKEGEERGPLGWCEMSTNSVGLEWYVIELLRECSLKLV